MTVLYKNKYKIKSNRLEGYDYSQEGMYFVTICTKNRECFFGNVIDKKVNLADIGKLAENFWKEIPLHFSFIQLDEFIIMPNHLHGIVEIMCPGVETRHGASLQDVDNRQFGPLQKKSLSSIMNQYKSSVKRWCNKNGFEYFQWQSNYHDHIIRNEIELNRIREYIYNNPNNWEEDRNNLENLYI